MDLDELNLLEKFYEKLVDSILKRPMKKVNKTSLIVVLFKCKDKEKHEILRDAIIPKSTINVDYEIFEKLLSQNLIKSGEKLGDFLITPNGILQFEKKKGMRGLSTLLNYIEDKFYSFTEIGKKQKFTSKDKILVFSMIAARTFSKSSCIDLNLEKDYSKYWMEIFEKSRKLLIQLDIIKDDNYAKLWRDTETDPLSKLKYFMSHRTETPKTSKNIYRSPGSRKYYLELSKDIPTMKIELEFLLQKVFDKELEYSEKETIVEFLKDISYHYHIRVFNPSEHKFHDSTYEDLLEDIVYYSKLTIQDY